MVSLDLFMSGFLRTVSTLRQDIFACLPATAGRQAFAVLEKARGGGRLPSWRVCEDNLRVWLAVGTRVKAQGSSPGGRGGSQRVTFFSAKQLIFFAAQPLSVMPCRLSGWKPASQTQARWVGRECVEGLPVTDRMQNPVYCFG